MAKNINNTLDRENDSYRRYNLVQNLGKGKYIVALDLRNASVIKLLKTCTAKYYKPLGKVEITAIDPNAKKRDIERTISSAADKINTIIKEHNKTANITKSTVTERYGKKGLIDDALVCELANPHYRCAAPMKMYDEDVIQFLLNTTDEEVEKRLNEKASKPREPRKRREISIEELKEDIELALDRFYYRLYWDIGKYAFKRYVLDIYDAHTEYDEILEIYAANEKKDVKTIAERLVGIEKEWYAEVFKRMCVDVVLKEKTA